MILGNFPLFSLEGFLQKLTRMHSSRMCTAHSLTVSPYLVVSAGGCMPRTPPPRHTSPSGGQTDTCKNITFANNPIPYTTRPNTDYLIKGLVSRHKTTKAFISPYLHFLVVLFLYPLSGCRRAGEQEVVELQFLYLAARNHVLLETQALSSYRNSEERFSKMTFS